jgi:putative oxidoreductase
MRKEWTSHMSYDHISDPPPESTVAAAPDDLLGAPFGPTAAERLGVLANRHGPRLLRDSMALIYIWFGALKLAGVSPVFALIGATLPGLDSNTTVPLLGLVEIALGVGLLLKRAQRIILVGVLGHLCGTFLTFVTAPGWVFHGYDPIRLTQDGEFVLKNLVLMSSAIVLLGMTRDSNGGRQ